MISFEADSSQTRAIEYPFHGPLLVIDGAAGTGKTGALLARAGAIAAALPVAQCVLVSAPSLAKLAPLAAACERGTPKTRIVLRLLGDIAFEAVVRDAHEAGREAPGLIDDVRAAHLFERAGAELFSLEWAEFVSAEVDPEIAGLRTPERFAAAAYRLIRKLRSAQIDPDAFEALCKRGATSFYGHAPNLAHPELIAGTQAQYRDSLRVDEKELMRQRQREIDLAKILARLYRRYLERLNTEGCYARVDALAGATKLLSTNGKLRETLLHQYPYACIDDAQDLTGGEAALLQALYGADFHGVTFAGDPAQATCTFAGALGGSLLAGATQRVTLERQYRCAPAILNVARRAIDVRAAGIPASEAVTLYRAGSAQDEAEYVADSIAGLLTAGTSPAQIAVITRSVRGAGAYLEALLERNVPVDIGGDANLYEFGAVQDALALLWSVADPYRHEYLLRVLESPWLALSDASIALLCGEPITAQPLLFELPKADGDAGRARWDPHRDLRLARNVTRGDRDTDLPAETRERLAGFRAARARWEDFERRLDLLTLANLIFAETVLAGRGQDARTRFEAGLIERLLDEVGDFARRRPLGSLLDFLHYVERVTETDEDLLSLSTRLPGTVSVLAVEDAKGREFEQVFLIDARASGFPRYYVPEAFLFYRSLGMIAKENVGEGAQAARTAKFTYALHKFKTRERYVEEERRAFACAATRARERLWISASGRPTRGAAAPEFLEELRASGLPGIRDVTNAWRPTRARVGAAIFPN